MPDAFPGTQTERTDLQLMLEISKDKQTFVTVSLKHTGWCLSFIRVFQQFTKEVTAALYVRPGIQKKLTHHLHTPPYSVFLICITNRAIFTASILQSSVQNIRIWGPTHWL